MEYAKAWAGGAAVLISFIVGQVWIELPESITAALATVLTGAVVFVVKNKKKPAPVKGEAGLSFIEVILVLLVVAVVLLVVRVF